MNGGKCTINNMTLKNIRKDKTYQAVIIDLAIVGAMYKEDAECLLGYKIPDYLQAPDGRNLKDSVDPLKGLTNA